MAPKKKTGHHLQKREVLVITGDLEEGRTRIHVFVVGDHSYAHGGRLKKIIVDERGGN